MITPALFTILPHQPFVDVLAKTLLDKAAGDPLALARMRVLLPTRRAINSLQEAFLRLSGGKPMLLPYMQPVGDVDEEEMLLAGWLSENARITAELPPVMTASRRILQLAQLIYRYHQLEYGRNARMDQAAQLARELAALLDEIAREELDITNIANIVPDNLSLHWKVTLDFLKIITQNWPDILEQEGKIDAITRRNRLLNLLSQHWKASAPDYPVIAAGTTGSAPATARLLRTIARLPQGMVVLPAWDPNMPDAVWQGMDETHPQFGMKLLLQGMSCVAADVQVLGEDNAVAHPRVSLLQAALQPATATANWRQEKIDWQAALAGCSRIDCATVQEEATTIALLLRDALSERGKTAALITPNRDLARRVSAIMRRFYVEIDDSAGIPLKDTPAGVLLHLLSDVAINQAAPVPLLSLLKHPLTLMGLPAGQCRHLARLLERKVLRGYRLAEGFAPINNEIINSKDISDKDKEALSGFVEQLFNLLSAYIQKMQLKDTQFADLLRCHIAVAEKISTTYEGKTMLWQGEEGEQLASFVHEVLASAEGGEVFDAASYAGIWSALIAGRTWRPRYGLHPRLQILSPMEARLQLFDRVVLGGLNESVWPMDVGQDPWMSRPMRSSFGLPLPERQIGLSAHDFLSLASAPEVFFVRAEKEGGAPSVPSRWLLRMEALLGVLDGEAAQNHWFAGGYKWREWAKRLDMVELVQSCPPPTPCPPLEARPRKLHVTRIETLLRNPYAIYAAKILQLKKLDPLDQEPGAAEFGTMVHNTIESYIKSSDKGFDILVQNGIKVFGMLLDRPAIETFWWPRFLRIAQWIIDEEARRNYEVKTIEAEQLGEIIWQAPYGQFSLKAYMDRIEILHSGSMRIIDYKTTKPPTNAEVERNIAAQLLLEAAMAQYGTIGGESRNGVVGGVEYWHLKGGQENATVQMVSSKNKSLEEMVNDALDGVKNLIASYDDENTPYLHVPVEANAPRYDDFAHLARDLEWRGNV